MRHAYAIGGLSMRTKNAKAFTADERAQKGGA